MLSVSKYSRKTVLAAIQVLKSLGHSGFDRLMLEIELSDSGAIAGGNLQDKANSLAKFALRYPEHLTSENKYLWDVLVDRAIEEDANYPPGMEAPNVKLKEREDLHNSLAEAPSSVAPRQAPQKGGLDNPVHLSKYFHPPASSVRAASPFISIESGPPIMKKEVAVKRRVFIVHGRDEAPKEAVARFIERLGFDAVILHEQANNGKTVIEKFIAHSEVHFAVVLLTPDDLGALNGDPPTPRARQNVILEWGFFIGALGRENVLALMKARVDLPSDVVGLVWEPFDDNGAWRRKLAKEMEASGFAIDWQKAGS